MEGGDTWKGGGDNDNNSITTTTAAQQEHLPAGDLRVTLWELGDTPRLAHDTQRLACDTWR